MSGGAGLPPGPVLVTGAGGCVGAWVLRTLARARIESVGFDLSDDRRRLALVAGDDIARAQIWETGDIADGARVLEVVRRCGAKSVVHLAALQVPFCAADPAGGARVNVVGTINVLEAVRALGIRRFVYASSSSAAAMGADSPWMQTLYGAFKVCNEQCARVYWRDWKVPSVGIRPSVIYGPGRDRGLSSKITDAMRAAAFGESREIPFTGGPVGFVYAEESALAFLAAAARAGGGAPVFDLHGAESSVERIVELVRARRPGAEISCAGEPLRLPPCGSDAPLFDYAGNYRRWTIEEGIDETLAAFDRLAAAGPVSGADPAGKPDGGAGEI